MKFTVEAWDPDYGTAGDVDSLDASTDVVDAGVEAPVGHWEEVEPDASLAAQTIGGENGDRAGLLHLDG